jgi:hypothetical protein
MLEKVEKILGQNVFRAFVIMLGILWAWHTFFGSVAELGQSRNISAQAENAVEREEAVRKGAVEEAKIKEATAREALRRQHAEADAAVAQACNARMQQLTSNMYLSDIDISSGTVKAGTPTARMMEQYNKDCNPAAAETPASEAAMKSYQGLKKLAMEEPGKLGERDASIQATCLIGVRIAVLFQLGEDDSTGMVADSFPLCGGAAIAYSLGEGTNTAFDALDPSKAPDESTRKVWQAQNSATDIKQCTAQRQNYTGLLACSCVAGAKLGAAKAIPLGDRRSLIARSEPICQKLAVSFADADGPEAANKYQQFLRLAGLLKMGEKIKAEFEAGHYEEAFKLSQKNVAARESEEIRLTGKAGDLTASALANHSWYALFTRQYGEVLAAADRSLKLKPKDLVPEGNRAHALMMTGRTGEAKTIYLAHKGDKLSDGRNWNDTVKEDFAELRKAGITHPLMAEIETALR